MFLQKLHLLNFKNYLQADFEFNEGVNCFVGDNGSGKTNLLDAIHYLSLCKSAFNATDSQNIFHGKDFFVIQGIFQSGKGEDAVYCSFTKGEKKQFKLNQKEHARLADHIGLFPVVLISPEDSLLVLGGSEERRRLIDSTIAQFDKAYLENIVSYNKVLLQRNSLLKHFAQFQRFDRHSLEAWDVQLCELGEKIFSKRKEFLGAFIPVFRKYFDLLSDNKEDAGIVYHTQLEGKKFAEILSQSLDKDRVMQFTTVGPHKDDLVFTLKGYAVKKFGSQGQQKSFLSAVKLAQFEFLKNEKNVKPILLLDDIFDKLDDHRVKRLMNIVSSDVFGQIFLTDTHPERAADLFRGIKVTPKVFVIE